VRPASLLILAVLLAAGCTNPSGRLEAGRVAPDFRAEDLTGQTHYLSAALARPVVLNFFATWCAPCREEMPHLADLHRRYSGRVEFLCVVTDPENKDKARALATAAGAGYPFLLDEEHTIKPAYGVVELPTTFLIAPDGTIRTSYLDFGPREADHLAGQLDRLLAKTP
jgi:peroxiredoxin